MVFSIVSCLPNIYINEVLSLGDVFYSRQASNFKASENDRLPPLTSTKILGKRLFAYLEEKFVTALFCEFVSLSSFR